MGFYNQDEEPVQAGADVAETDTVVTADVSVDGKIYSLTMQALRQVMSRGLTNATAATLTVTAADHAGQVITFNRAGGIATTLPAATGSGNKYRFIVGTTFTSSATIKVVGNDTMVGHAILLQDSADTAVAFEAGGTDDTVTMNGTTTGGLAGMEVELIDIATDLWFVKVIGGATGTEATPFSATV